MHSITKPSVERVAVEVVVVGQEVVGFPGGFLRRRGDGRRRDAIGRGRRHRRDRRGVLCLSPPEQRLPERDLVLGVGEQAGNAAGVGADVGAERLPRVGLLGLGLARDAPPRRPQRAAVEGQGAVRFGFRRRRDGDGLAAGRVRLGHDLREAVELLRERPRRVRREALERQRATKAHGGLDWLYDRGARRRGRPSSQLRPKARAAQNNDVAGDRCCCVDERLLHVFVLQSEHRHVHGPDVDTPLTIPEPVDALPQQGLP